VELHEVVSYGVPCNDGTADLVLWCSTCEKELATFSNSDDNPPFETLARIVAEHQKMTTRELFAHKAAAWVRKNYPGHEPVHGTVTFATNVSSYGGELDADIDVSWSEMVHQNYNGGFDDVRPVVRTLETKAYDYDLNELIIQVWATEVPDAN